MTNGLLAVVLAAAMAKPGIVYYRPAECPQFCDAFVAAVAHPAMQRRLASVTFETKTAKEAAIAVVDPNGREVMRWDAMPDWLALADILTLLDQATPHILAATSDDPIVAEREWALAVLAMGDRERGRALLEAMRSSKSVENQQLAAIWLQRLAEKPSDELLIQHEKTGATERVRVEAAIALGDVKMKQGRFPDAIASYDRAVALAADKTNARQNALTARQRAVALAVPVLGLGAPGSVVSGRKTIQPRGLGKNVKRVEFRLDGRLVATARRAPFAAGVFFGKIPTRQVLEVTSFNAAGKVLDRSSVVVNERGDAFAVKFLQPSSDTITGTVDVALDVRVPRGRSVEEVRVEWNGATVARFTAPPYRTSLTLSGEQGLLRAVLRLDDGSEVEDALLAGALPYEAEAHLVEVPVYFDAPPASPSDVIVKEAGRRRTVEQVIRPTDAPLLIALLIDSSASMKEHMLDVQEAAIRFIDETIEPRDSAMVVPFSQGARMIQWPGRDRELLKRSILALRPRGMTSLYDAIVSTLLQLQSTGSRKALVVFSDGYDLTSVFSVSDVEEVARRAGVPIYVLMLTPAGELKQDAIVARNEYLALSKRSGARSFEFRSLDKLGAFWTEIGADLRRQSLVIYRTDTAGAEWRPIELSVKDGSPVRAPSGVYVTSDR